MTSGALPTKPLPTTSASTDTIARVIGDFGIWQLRAALIIFLCKIPASWFMACIIFTAPELLPGEFECEAGGNNTASEDQCYVHSNATGTTEACESFNYFTGASFYSLIMQFDLLCKRDILVAWTQFWHLFGILLGGVFATKMMIWISPKRVMTIGAFLQIGFGCLTGYVNEFNLHCFFRCLSAVCCSIMMTSGQTIFTEITGGKYRTGLIILYDTFWSIGLFFLPALSALFSTWSQIYLGITFPTIAIIILLKWTPEAPRWLLLHETDVFQVEEILLNAANVNDRLYAVPDNLRFELQIMAEKVKATPPPAGWWELWRGPRAKTHFIASHLALALYIINFMGLLLNTRSFGREYLVVNTIITGVSEVIGCFLALHITMKYNPIKWQCSGIFNIAVGLIGCLGWVFPDSLRNPGREAMWILISSLAKAGVSLAQSMLLACLPELWPASKKHPFMFSVVTWARIWLLTAPFVNVLKKIEVAMSLSTFCMFSIIGGIATLFIRTPKEDVATKSTVTDNQDNKINVWTIADTENNTRL